MSYDDEEDSMKCRKCHGDAKETAETACCELCPNIVQTGRLLYNCKSCGKKWPLGNRTVTRWGDGVVCADCQQANVGNCTICGQPKTPKSASFIEGAVCCHRCLNSPEPVWCPKCEKKFPYKGYLKGAFRDDPAGFQAAALVTHYRHEHIVSHDRAWQNKRYAKPIPGYDYDTKKLDVNNRAKRQLIRAIRRHMLNGTYSAEAPVPGLALIEAFGRLKDGDDETIKCIRSTLEKLGAGPTH